jgi:trigger factor
MREQMNAIESLEMTSISPHECELKITVASKMVHDEFTSTLNKIQRVASRPGFRAGKMPKSMVLNFYKSEIKQKLIEELFKKSFELACQQKELVPVSQPKMEPLGEIDQERAFTYRAMFQVKPKVEIAKYLGLAIELRHFVFDESDVEDEINNLRESHATFIEPHNRMQVAEDDLVQCDSVVKIDSEISTKYSHKNYTIPLFADNIPAEIRTSLVGKKVGEMALVKYHVPEEDQDEEIKGKDCETMLTIKSFKSRILPALDDDFAKDLSDKFTCIEDIKESIRLRFKITIARRNEYFRQEAITRALVEENSLQVPPALVERMAMSLINRELEAMGEKTSNDLVKNHWQEMWQSVQERAIFRTKAELLFEALINTLSITASDEEVVKRLEKIENINRDDAAYSIRVEKLLNAIEKEAIITMVEEPLFKKSK